MQKGKLNKKLLTYVSIVSSNNKNEVLGGKNTSFWVVLRHILHIKSILKNLECVGMGMLSFIKDLLVLTMLLSVLGHLLSWLSSFKLFEVARPAIPFI